MFTTHHKSIGNGRPRRRVPRRWTVAFALAAVTLSVAACNDLLDIEDPDIILPPSLEGPEGLNTLYNGVLSDFAVAYSSGTNDALMMAVGFFTDEFMNSGTFPTREEVARRNINEINGTMETVFRNIHRARVAAEDAVEPLTEFGEDPASDPRIGEMWSLAGYTYLFLAENYCNGIPFSRAPDDGALEFGQPLTNAEVFDLAIQRFDAALASAAGSDEVTNAARVGRARALLNLGQFDDAAADAAQVPDGFGYRVGHSVNTTGQNNQIYYYAKVDERMSVWDGKGGNGLPFRTAADPRVPFERTPADDLGFDRFTAQYDQLKYPGRDSPVELTNSAEARLIEAEAALNNNDASWLTILQDLRANSGLDFTGVPALADQGSLDANVDLLFSERAFWHYATGRRLSDLRRLMRQYGRAEDDVFPTGGYEKGGLYGDAVNFPIPFDEQQNPNFVECIDRLP